MAPQGLALRLEEQRWDQSPTAQPRPVGWPRVLLWLEKGKNELLCKKWEERQCLKDLHPLPSQHLQLQHFFISLAPRRAALGVLVLHPAGVWPKPCVMLSQGCSC